MGYEGWSISALWGEYDRVSKQMSDAKARLARLEAAWSALKAPKNSCQELKKVVQYGKFGEECGYWKGKLKTQFDQNIDSIGTSIKFTWNRMDEFHDEINHQISKAKIESGRYVPVVTELKGLINKLS